MPSAAVAVANMHHLTELERDSLLRAKFRRLAPDHTVSDIRYARGMTEHGVDFDIYEADLTPPTE